MVAALEAVPRQHQRRPPLWSGRRRAPHNAVSDKTIRHPPVIITPYNWNITLRMWNYLRDNINWQGRFIPIWFESIGWNGLVSIFGGDCGSSAFRIRQIDPHFYSKTLWWLIVMYLFRGGEVRSWGIEVALLKRCYDVILRLNYSQSINRYLNSVQS